MKRFASPLLAAAAPMLLACSAPGEGPSASVPGGAASTVAPGLALGALDGAARTIPYGGYVDFDGEPVNAGAVGFNFVIFPCATPGTGAGGCSHLWVAKGTFTDGATWTNGWPSGASDELDLPIFSGRFAVELGAAGQNPLPEAVFDSGGEPLYLGVRVEGRALGALQKIVPTTRTHTAALAESARVADMVGDLTPEEIASRRSWATSGEVAPGATLELQTFGDATDAEVFLWERRGTTWVALDPDHDLADDPALVAWYPFEDVAGTQITDASGHARHLTTSGTVTFGQEGVRGSAVAFGASGGAADSSTFGHVMTPTSSLTIAMWLRPNKLNSDDYPFLLYRDTSTRDYQFHFFSLNGVCPNGRVSFDSVTGLVGDGTCTRHSAPPGVWTHIAATVDPDRDTAIVYVNGVASDLESGTAGVPTGTLNYLRLGNFAFGSPQTFFDGRMDELVILGRALSPEEVADLHRYGVGGAYPIARHTDGRVTVTNTSATPRTLRLLVVK